MIDINLIRTNPELVKENMKAKFQDNKLPLVDEVIELDQEFRQIKVEADGLRQNRNAKSTEIGTFMRNKEIDKANALKAEVAQINDRLKEIEVREEPKGLDMLASGGGEIQIGAIIGDMFQGGRKKRRYS